MEKSRSSEVLKWGKNRRFNTSDGNFWEFQRIFDPIIISRNENRRQEQKCQYSDQPSVVDSYVSGWQMVSLCGSEPYPR